MMELEAMTGTNLKSFSDLQLVALYRESALAHRSASRDGKYKIANPAARTLDAIFVELCGRAERGRAELLKLLDDGSVEVRGWAAAQCLDIFPQASERVLTSIAAGPASLEEFSAKLILAQRSVDGHQ